MSDSLAQRCAKSRASVRWEQKPGDIGEIVKMHGMLYAQEHGFSSAFEAYVAGTFGGYSWPLSARERLWVVEKDGTLAGTIAIVKAAESAAQLRWLLLRADLRGLGLGGALVEEALAFCRSSDYASVFLWTVSSLTAATAIYRRAGFTRTEERIHELWGGIRTEERYDLSLL